jgi:hypothetical protein
MDAQFETRKRIILKPRLFIRMTVSNGESPHVSLSGKTSGFLQTRRQVEASMRIYKPQIFPNQTAPSSHRDDSSEDSRIRHPLRDPHIRIGRKTPYFEYIRHLRHILPTLPRLTLTERGFMAKKNRLQEATLPSFGLVIETPY